MADTKWSQFQQVTGINPTDSLVGLQNNDNTRFSFATILAWVRQQISSFFVPKTDVGAVNGVASLDNTGKVPSSQLPSSTGPEPATATPLMDGTGAVGASTKYAREDHEHPTDTNKQNTITASGILKGDGQGGVSAATQGTDYQAPLTIDATPTASSTNPVQSGGVYDALAQKVSMTNPSQGPYTASASSTAVGSSMSGNYYYKSIGDIVFVGGLITPSGNQGVADYTDLTLASLPKDIDTTAPFFNFSLSATISGSDYKPYMQMLPVSGKKVRFMGACTSGRGFYFSIIYC